MTDLLQALNAIRQALDLAANVEWFVAHNVEIVFDALRTFIFRTSNPTTPNAPFTTVGPIQTFAPLVQVAADSALTAILTWAAFRMLWGQTTLRSQLVLRLLLPRLLLATLLINFAVPFVQLAIDFGNALSDGVMLATRAQILADVGEFSGDGWFAGLQGVTLIVLFASYGVLAFAYVVRYALLVVLTILAPVAALLFVLPETQRYGREWVSLFVTTLLMQPLQLLILAVGLQLEMTGDTIWRHGFALASLWLCYKVPGALHSASTIGTHASGMAKRRVMHLVHAAARL